jgi:phosphoribosylformimino-5-aminoimidazole carboxamide ribotide isomerase
MALQVVPAVDVLGNTATRLERGEFDRVVARAGDPEALVRRFADAGAPLVHAVDLDGARRGVLRTDLFVRLVASARPAGLQASGGVRSPEDAHALVGAGAERVVVGTAALADPDALARYVDALGDRLVVALDIRDGCVRTAGWTRTSGLTIERAAERCAAAGVTRVLCTAIDRDGTLGGPDLELLRRVRELAGAQVLAAGGIASERDLDAVEGAGCEAAVVGRALLEGRIPLARVGVPAAS